MHKIILSPQIQHDLYFLSLTHNPNGILIGSALSTAHSWDQQTDTQIRPRYICNKRLHLTLCTVKRWNDNSYVQALTLIKNLNRKSHVQRMTRQQEFGYYPTICTQQTTHIFTYGSERPLESMAASPAQRLMPTVSWSMFVLNRRLTKMRPRSEFIKSSSFSTFRHNAPIARIYKHRQFLLLNQQQAILISPLSG